MTRFKLFLVGMGAVWAATGALAACGGDDKQTDAGDAGGGDVIQKKDIQVQDVVDDTPVVHPAARMVSDAIERSPHGWRNACSAGALKPTSERRAT